MLEISISVLRGRAKKESFPYEKYLSSRLQWLLVFESGKLWEICAVVSFAFLHGFATSRLRSDSNQPLSSTAKRFKASRIAIYFIHCVELLFNSRLIAFLVLEGICISSKRSSEKGEVFLRETYFELQQDGCSSSSQVNFGKSVLLFISYFHTALLRNITNLIGTKRGRKLDFSAKAVAHCHRLGKTSSNFRVHFWSPTENEWLQIML